MRKSFIACLSGFVFLAGCMEPMIVEPTVPFDATAASFANKKGRATISGQAFLRQRGGGVVTCAASEVSLIPDVEYSRQRMEGMYGSVEKGYTPAGVLNRIPPAKSDAYNKSGKNTTCDAQGNFSFENISNGEYFVVTTVGWQVSEYTQEGGALMQHVSVSNGRNVKVLLSR
jgi:hypothetical protein